MNRPSSAGAAGPTPDGRTAGAPSPTAVYATARCRKASASRLLDSPERGQTNLSTMSSPLAAAAQTVTRRCAVPQAPYAASPTGEDLWWHRSSPSSSSHFWPRGVTSTARTGVQVPLHQASTCGDAELVRSGGEAPRSPPATTKRPFGAFSHSWVPYGCHGFGRRRTRSVTAGLGAACGVPGRS